MTQEEREAEVRKNLEARKGDQEAQIAEAHRRGEELRKRYEAEAAAARAEREAAYRARVEGACAAREERMKSLAQAAWVEHGGDAAKFDENWPAIREAALLAAAIDAATPASGARRSLSRL